MTPADLIVKMLSSGSALAAIIAIVLIFAVPGWVAWWYERRRTKELSDRVLDLATAQTEATVKQSASIEANTKVMERFLQ